MVNMQGVLRRALRSPLWSVGIIVLIIAIILIASSLRKLESTELGVRYDTINRRIFDDVFEEGLHPGPPFFRFLKLSSNFVTEPIVTTCYTKVGSPGNKVEAPRPTPHAGWLWWRPCFKPLYLVPIDVSVPPPRTGSR
mmetsp:Transcript_23183/g.72421  ORF Transcript_23183/g.72421 Transcript_23183/m.72421 type:complete len:138 (+) Transcript_23183:1213-1626(+)